MTAVTIIDDGHDEVVPPCAACPHCNKLRVVMPSGLFELHSVQASWGWRVCRGSGKPSRIGLATAS